MKHLKKLAVGVVALAMAFALTACGGKEQTVSYHLEQEESGLKMTDDITLEAKGDLVQKITETVVVDVTAFEADQQDQVFAVYDQMVATYDAVEGVDCTGGAGEGSYSLEIVMDLSTASLSELSELGMLQVTGEGDQLSLKQSKTGLEASGYTLVE